MATDDLHTPLRMRAREPGQRRGASILIPLLVSLAGLVALIATVWVAIVDDPRGGEPFAIAQVEEAPPESTGSVPQSSEPAALAPAPDPNFDLVAMPVAPSQPMGGAGAYQELLEPSEYGLLPRIGAAGLRPIDAYGRRADPAASGKPRVVIVIGGMGISQTGTQRAIEALPEDITLAFAPYGSSLQRWVDKARDEGHEVLLQVPLEPADFPNTDPGEHTLLVSSDPATVDADLKWSLGQMTSYTGVMNYMGGRFTSDGSALGRFLSAIGSRGLLYLDDGTSPASRAQELGGMVGAPVLSADLVLDSDRDPAAVEAALLALEDLARTNGVAIGTASAFQTSIDAIANWASEADSRGIAIISPSALVR